MAGDGKAGSRGLAASIHDLKLRDGRAVTALVGGNIVSPPKLVRTIEGATELVLEITDPELRWLDHALARAKWTCTLDGLEFRYKGTAKSGITMTLTFEDEIVARLREVKGPIRVYAHRGQDNEVTLAEFLIRSIVEKAPGPPIPWVCPQLEEQQPIKSSKQAKKASEQAEVRRGKAIGETRGLKVKGQAPSKQQAELLEMAIRIGDSHAAPPQVEVACVAALIDETNAGEVGNGNVLQAEQEITGPGGEGAKVGTPVEEINGFYTNEPEWTGEGAIEYFAAHPNASPGEIAAAIQGNANGAADYDRFVAEAREWVKAYNGGTIEGAGGKEIVKPRYFYVKGEGKRQKRKPETGWDAIQRYAEEVNWGAFADLGTFYYFDEFELSRGEVRLAIVRQPGERRPENRYIEDLDFEYDEETPVTEATVTALASKWGVAPGAVVTAAGYGPASLGPGDPVAKEPGENAISSGVEVGTHEGKGRYLAATIEVALIGAPAVRKATVTLRKPTRPLAEGASETETLSSTSSARALTSAGIPKGVAEGIEEANRINALKWDYESPGVRGTPPSPEGPKDCSGVTSRIAFVICGEPKTTLASQELSEFGEPGEGEWFTIYAHGPNGPSGHALSHIKKPDGTWWFFGTSDSNPGGGAGWIPESEYDASYLAAFQKRHPKGF